MIRLLKTLLRLQRSPNRVFVEFAPPGHYYSPLPDLEEVRRRAETLFDRDAGVSGGIDLRADAQLELLRSLGPLSRDLPFAHERSDAARYFFNNSFFSYGDAVVLATMMRHLRPARVLEVGSGFSSAVMLDVDETFLDSRTDLTLVEPHPERLESLLRPGDLDRARLLRMPVQMIPVSEVERLEEGDFLFIDSSHVLKCGGDLNFLLFEVLPVLNDGVIVHFHDVLWPFEYPQGWLETGIAWNEAYALRAFLQYNRSFEVLLFGSFLEHCHRDQLEAHLPLALERPDDRTTPSNGSLWLRRSRRV